MCPASPPFLVLQFAFSIIHESGRVVKNRESKLKHKKTKKGGGLGTRLGIPDLNCLGFAVEHLNTSVNPLPTYILWGSPPLLSPYAYPTSLTHLCPPISQMKGILGRRLKLHREWSLTKICQMEYPLAKPRMRSRGSTGPSPTREWCSIEMSAQKNWQ